MYTCLYLLAQTVFQIVIVSVFEMVTTNQTCFICFFTKLAINYL